MRAVTRLYSTIIFLFSIQELTAANDGRIHCGNALFCFPNKTSNDFEYYNKISKELETLVRKNAGENVTSIPMVVGSPLFQRMTEGRKYLCNELSFTGFLLDENTHNLTTHCVWNGRDYNGMCMPAAKTHSVFYYIGKDEWKKKLQIYRQKIGCSAKEILKVDAAEEQYICRERCMQGGISYAASMIMIISFCIAFMINCV